MAILGRDGQLIANASQRTLVFETVEGFSDFRKSLPEGTNVFEAFDIYVRESGEVYAAGQPFKLRETTEEDLNLYISKTGTGDGETQETPISQGKLLMKLAALAANYDFNNHALKLWFEDGNTYTPLMFLVDFLNCRQIVVNSWSDTKKMDGTGVIFAATSAGPCVLVDTKTPIVLKNVGFSIQRNSGIFVREGGEVELDNTFFSANQNAINHVTGHQNDGGIEWGFVHARGGTITVRKTDGEIMDQEVLEYLQDGTHSFQRGFFVADTGGLIRFGPYSDVLTNIGVYVGRCAVFYATENGIIDLSGVPTLELLTGNIDDGMLDVYHDYENRGWAVATRGGIIYLPTEDTIPHITYANCDSSATLVKEERQ